MQTPDEITDNMRGIRDQVLAYLRAHELAEHGGEPCMRNRASVVGYLAHSLGVRSLQEIGDAIALYDLHCPGCEHQRN